MSGRARDALSLSRIFIGKMRSGGIPPALHSVPFRLWSVRLEDLPFGTIHRYTVVTFVQRLEPKKIQLSDFERSPSNAVRLHPLKCTLSGQHRAHALLSRSSYQTSAPSVEKEGFQLETDGREEVKQALAEYLELSLKVRKQLAINISENSPSFVDGLVDQLHVLQKKDSSHLDRDLNTAVKELLAKSKCKGVEPFLESLGVKPEDIEKVSDFARSGVKGVLVKVDLLKAIGIKSEEIPKVIASNPRFLSNALVNNQVKVEYLAQLGMSPVEICKLIIQYPNSLSFGLKDGGLPLVKFLKNAGVKDEDVCKVLIRCPQLLTLNVERKLLPAIETLGTVGIKGSYLARVLVMQPSLLRRRLERNIAFCREFGLDSKPGVIARLLVTCPNFSVDGCSARVSYLEGIGLTKEQIVMMINRNPAFLSLNVKTALAPKVNYLLNVMGRPVDQLVTAATFLTMSLEHRIKPRHEILAALKEAGLLKRDYSLTTMVTWSEGYFFEKFVQNSPPHIRDLWKGRSAGSVPPVDGAQYLEEACFTVLQIVDLLLELLCVFWS
ncbi:unnamed protein product [Calypogeia fissa]